MGLTNQAALSDALLLEGLASERIVQVAGRAVYEEEQGDGQVVLRAHLAEVQRSVDDLMLTMELESIRTLPIEAEEALELSRELRRLAGLVIRGVGGAHSA